MLEADFTIRSLDISSTTLGGIVAGPSGNTIPHTLTFQSSGGVSPSLTASVSLAFSANPDGQGLVTLDLANTTTFDTSTSGKVLTDYGPIVGSGGLIKSGPGTLVLGIGTATTEYYSSSYSGGTTINAGTISIQNNGSTGTPDKAQLGNGSVTVNSGAALNFDNCGTVDGSSVQTLTISGSGISNNGVLLESGTHNGAWDGTVLLSGGSTLNVATSGFLLTGNITDTVNHSITKIGAGTFAPVNMRIGTLTINTGTITVQANGGTLGTSVVNSITLAGGTTPTASLDLTNHDMVVNYSTTSPIGTIEAQIGYAYDGGPWDRKGINSNKAGIIGSGTLERSYGIGYAEATDVLNFGTNSTATFSGQTVDKTSVLLKYTLSGDLNLDGAVDSTDAATLEANYGKTGQEWYQGDVTYDGTINSDDFSLLSLNYGHSLTMDSPESIDPLRQLYESILNYPQILADAKADPQTWALFAPYADGASASSAVAVPEPLAASSLFCALGCMLARRKRGW